LKILFLLSNLFCTPSEMNIKNNKGFTIIELMVVVAIIAILAAIAIPNYLGIQKKAARSEAKSNLLALSIALEGYMAENNNYGPIADYVYSCGDGCTKSSFVPPFPVPPAVAVSLENIANLGGGYGYDYVIHVTSLLNPAYVISALPQRGRVAKDKDVIMPYIRSNGDRGPAYFGW